MEMCKCHSTLQMMPNQLNITHHPHTRWYLTHLSGITHHSQMQSAPVAVRLSGDETLLSAAGYVQFQSREDQNLQTFQEGTWQKNVMFYSTN